MNFVEAIEHLKKGEKVQRKSWKGVVLDRFLHYDGKSKRPDLYHKEGVPPTLWSPTMDDLVATDWQVR